MTTDDPASNWYAAPANAMRAASELAEALNAVQAGLASHGRTSDYALERRLANRVDSTRAAPAETEAALAAQRAQLQALLEDVWAMVKRATPLHAALDLKLPRFPGHPG